MIQDVASPLDNINHISTFVGEVLPFLDIGIKGNSDGSIHFVATRKENQLVKYVSSSSNHTQTVLKAIRLGVLERLAKLTSPLEAKLKQSIVDLYPVNVKALVNAGLIENNKIPTLIDVLNDMNNPACLEAKIERENDYKDKRNIFFSLAGSKLWPTSVWKLIKKIRDKHDLQRLRIRMSYHTFPNFGQLLQADLIKKLNKGIYSLDYVDRE